MIVKISLISFNSTPPTNICFVKKWKRRSIAAHDTLVQVTTQKVNHVAQLAENDLHHRRKYLAEPDLQRESRLCLKLNFQIRQIVSSPKGLLGLTRPSGLMSPKSL